MFTRDGEQANNLFDMQATWYEIASGRAYLRQGQHGKVCMVHLHLELEACPCLVLFPLSATLLAQRSPHSQRGYCVRCAHADASPPPGCPPARAQALKRFLKVDAHFADFVEDQFDFHGYCLRKLTMRAYVDMLRMEDGLHAHPVYGKAVAGAVAAYLQLADGAGPAREAAAYAAMAPEEQKK